MSETTELHVPDPAEVSARALADSASAPTPPSPEYLGAFVHAAKSPTLVGNTLEVRVTFGRFQDGPVRKLALEAAHATIEARGWRLARTEPTGMRDNGYVDVWTAPATPRGA
jgi:hypothetical protein